MGMHRRPRSRRPRRWKVVVSTSLSFGLLSTIVVIFVVPDGGGGSLWAGQQNAGYAPGTGHGVTTSPGAKGGAAAKNPGWSQGNLPASASAPSATVSATPSGGAPSGAPFDGTPTVGALFQTDGNGKLQSHFCTASVVDSPSKDTIVTAAHCLGRNPRSGGLDVAFVPGYHDGKAPYGVWTATKYAADADWASSADPDHDVGFLRVTAADGGTQKLQDLTGAEQISIGHPTSGSVRVIGYPNATERPISCQNRISAHSARQMEFDCPGYVAGTSGGPFVASDGGIIGVIGGFQQGGLEPDVSYSATFGSNVRDLYTAAIS